MTSHGRFYARLTGPGRVAAPGRSARHPAYCRHRDTPTVTRKVDVPPATAYAPAQSTRRAQAITDEPNTDAQERDDAQADLETTDEEADEVKGGGGKLWVTPDKGPESGKLHV